MWVDLPECSGRQLNSVSRGADIAAGRDIILAFCTVRGNQDCISQTEGCGSNPLIALAGSVFNLFFLNTLIKMYLMA